MHSGAWKTAQFKKYNFEADGIPTSGGALHPLLKVREEIRGIFLEMGYVIFTFAFLLDCLTAISASKKCQPAHSSSQVSGASMPFLYHNFTPQESCKIRSTYLVSISMSS